MVKYVETFCGHYTALNTSCTEAKEKYERLPSETETIQNNERQAKHINPFMPNGLFYLHSSNRPISNIRGVWLVVFFLSPCFIEIPVFNANSVDPDQTPRSAASDLGLHCLLMSLLWDAIGLNGLMHVYARA